MHLLTHALAGWCVGCSLPTSPKERALCIGVSLLPDIDGLSIVGGVQAFYDYHHVLAHNLLFGAASLLLIWWLARCRPLMVLVFVALFHLHLLMDLFGSGPGWGIAYFWPFSSAEYSTRYSWQIDAWQNYAALAALAVWTIAIAVCQKRTPFEYVAPRFDPAILAVLRRSRSDKNQTPGRHSP